MCVCGFFFFKQKTAYEMRISDWSSDVCSSDLAGEGAEGEAAAPVIMDAAALKAAGIRLQTLQPSSLSEELRAPGEVLDNAYGTTLITPRVEALIVRRHARLGEEVPDGAPPVTLSSVDVAE